MKSHLILAILIATPVQDEFVQNNTKRFKDHQRINNFIKKLPEIRQKAFKEVSEGLGVEFKGHDSVIIRINDIYDTTNKKIKPPDYGMYTSFKLDQGRKIAYIDCWAEYIISDNAYVSIGLKHEAVHAVLGMHLWSLHDKLSVWMKEGLAVYVGDELNWRIEWTLINPDVLKNPAAVINGLEDEGHGSNDYLEDGLAIELLVTRDKDAVKKLVAKFEADVPYTKAVEEIYGKPFKTFLEDARNHSINRLKDFAKSKEYQSYKEVYDGRVANVVLERCDRFLKDYPRSYLSTPVLFYKGTALSLMKKFTDAMNVLDEYLDGTHNRYRCWSIAARILRADVYKHMNNHDKAVLELRSAAEDYFDDPVDMQRAWFELGFLYHQTGKKGPAKKTLGTALESFPNHKEAARAKRILKELGDEKVD